MSNGLTGRALPHPRPGSPLPFPFAPSRKTQNLVATWGKYIESYEQRKAETTVIETDSHAFMFHRRPLLYPHDKRGRPIPTSANLKTPH